jgi:hypothetical protein
MQFDDGLSDEEIARIESHFHFVFPPDLRFFLQTALPISSYFVNWRAEPDELETWFARLIDGVLFDVQSNTFWHRKWGPRPEATSTALRFAKEQLANAPHMIPIGDPVFAKYLPTIPNAAGNPVFSIRQTDALHAGRDLADFLQWYSRPNESFDRDEEQGISPTPPYCDDYRFIPFWTDLVRCNVVT